MLSLKLVILFLLLLTIFEFHFLPPQSGDNLEQFLLLHDSLEVDPVHGQDLLHLLDGKLVKIVQGGDFRQVDQALVGKATRTAASNLKTTAKRTKLD